MAAHRFLVVWCPGWSIQAAREEHTLTDSPLALSHGHYVTACCDAAREQGVRPGQKIREAQNTCPQLQLLPDRPERDQRVFERVLSHLADTVAQLSVLEPGTLVCRAAGLARYFGSEQAAAHALRLAIGSSPVPVAARVGVADSLFTAQHAARLGTSEHEPVCIVEPGQDAEFLAPLPVSTLDDSHLAALLQRLGITSLGDFAGMDSHQVRERFGPSGELLQRCAAGDDPRSTSQQGIPPGTDVVWRSDDPISDLDSLSFALLTPANRFIDGLTAAHSVCTSLSIRMLDDRGEEHTAQWTHPRYFSANDVINRVRWQWDSVARTTPEEYQHTGIVEVTFHALTPDDITWHEPGLWTNAVNHRVEHVVAQLQSQLGYQSVRHARRHAGHRLTETDTFVPWGDGSVTSTVDEEAWPGALPKPLPATVFSPPLPVQLVGENGDAVEVSSSELSCEPVTMTSSQSSRVVKGWAGPWPVVERWWDQENSNSRYRLQLLDSEGVGWLISCPREGGSWMAEARYD